MRCIRRLCIRRPWRPCLPAVEKLSMDFVGHAACHTHWLVQWHTVLYCPRSLMGSPYARSHPHLQVVEWMMRSDIKPNVRTYTALITALGNARQWEKALDIVARMKRHGYGAGIEPNAYTYSGEWPGGLCSWLYGQGCDVLGA